MSKFLTATVLACFAIGWNPAIAKDVTAAQANAKAWKDFQAQVDKCKMMSGSERTQCMESYLSFIQLRLRHTLVCSRQGEMPAIH